MMLGDVLPPHPNPVSAMQAILSAVFAAGGIVAFVAGARLRRRPSEVPPTGPEGATPDGVPPVPPPLPPTPPPLTPGGFQAPVVPIVPQPTDEDIANMKHSPDGYTSFFTPEVEAQFVSALQGFRQRRQIEDCEPVFVPVPEGGSTLKWLVEAEQATRATLSMRYPTGAPWDSDDLWHMRFDDVPDDDTRALWRWWLWNRVKSLAKIHVCNFTQ